MRTISYTTRFRKDVKKMQKAGAHYFLYDPISKRCEKNAESRQRHGKIKNWLLVYKLDDDHLTFERTGTHADLFS